MRKKTELITKELLIALFAVLLVMSNIFASRIIKTGINVFDVPLTLPGGILLYPFTFLCTDILGERYGKKISDDCVWIGFICQIGVVVFEGVSFLLPSISQEVNESYRIVFGQGMAFVVASIVSYLISQSCDVYVFHKIRNHFVNKESYHGQGRWIWNNCSTILSQLLDTVVFSLVGFGIGMGWLYSHETRVQMVGLMTGQYVCKVALAVLDTPVFYLLTMRKKDDIDCNSNAKSTS